VVVVDKHTVNRRWMSADRRQNQPGLRTAATTPAAADGAAVALKHWTAGQ